jgi:adenylate cyclase class 2
MAQETEIKLKISDLKAFQRALKRIGAKDSGLGRVHEMNVIFDTPEGRLGKRGQLLRIRTETRRTRAKRNGGRVKERFLLTFKRPTVPQQVGLAEQPEDGAYKVREEIEVEVKEAAILSKIFEVLGMRGWFRYEKYRTTYRIGGSKRWSKGLLIEVDETPIGVFAELEGPPDAIDRAAEKLGFSQRDYVLRNYLTLYVEDCRQKGIEPKDMVFAAKRTQDTNLKIRRRKKSVG